MGLTSCLLRHHKQCDDLFADAEGACADGDWEAGSRLFLAMDAEIERHFKGEEEVLFPAFEAATGMRFGPTEVMRDEHRKMRALLAAMKQAQERQDGDAFGGHADTLLVMMQQHNMKEENILYPMCDRALDENALGESLQAYLHPAD